MSLVLQDKCNSEIFLSPVMMYIPFGVFEVNSVSK